MNNQSWIVEKINAGVPFSPEEINELKNVIQEIRMLAEKGRRNGLLSLESSIDELNSPLLRLGIALISEGVDPGPIETTLENTLIAVDKTPIEYMKDLAAIQGLLLVQDGQNPKIIETQLSALAGAEYALKVWNSK